jgi:gas vesicle protein
MSRDNRRALVTFFIVGAGVGAVAALLLAPKSGEQLRDEISQGASDHINQLHKKVTRAARRAQGLANRVTDQVQDAAAAAENAFNNATKD